MEEVNVGVIGSGYVGLVTGACMAHVGHRTTCVDKVEERIAELSAGRLPICESGLQELVTRSVRGGRLSFVGTYGSRGYAPTTGA